MKKCLVVIFIYANINLVFGIGSSVDNTTLYNVALGGSHTSMVAGVDTFYNNPALFSKYDKELSLFKFGVNMKGDTLDLLNLFLGGDFSLDDPTALLSTLEENSLNSLLVGLDMLGPVSVGGFGNNWGWNIKNGTNLSLKLPSLLSSADFTLREDISLSVGISFPFKFLIGNSFFIEVIPGVMSRTTFRAQLDIEKGLFGLMTLAQNLGTLLEDNPAYISPMFSIDAGFLVNIYDLFTISGVIKDLYTPILKYEITSLSEILSALTSSQDTSGNLVSREINLGCGVDVPLGPLTFIISDLDLYLDYFDLLNFDRNIFLHWGIGADIELLNKFHLLGGMNEGLVSLGLNVDLGGFDVGFAMYGSEEGSQPGANSTFNFLLSTGISI